MSQNVEITFLIQGITDIHKPENQEKKKELLAAADKFLLDIDFDLEEMQVDFGGQEGYLEIYTTRPIVMSGAYQWEEVVSKKWKEFAFNLVGNSCEPSLVMEYEDLIEIDQGIDRLISSENIDQANKQETTLSPHPIKKPWWKFW